MHQRSLQLLHGRDISRLDMVLVLLNFSLEVIDRNLVVFDNQVDL